MGRLAASVCEAHRDDYGPIWPISIAPWHVHLCSLRADNEEVAAVSQKIYDELTARGVEVIWDDRSVSAGVMFSDADLFGVPVRVVVSPKGLKNGTIEISARDKSMQEKKPVDEAVDFVYNYVVDELAKRLGVAFGKEDRNAYCAEYRAPEKILIIKPTTYMNLSGIAVGNYANFYHIDPEDIAVIQDDLDLPVGHLRIRRKGSAGGHNGIKSITEHLGTEEYPRFKIGIGHPDRNNKAVINHVLHQFQGEDKAAIETAVKAMAEALEQWLKDGDLNAVMTKYNTKKAKKEKPPKKQATEEQQTETKVEQAEATKAEAPSLLEKAVKWLSEK